MEESNLPVKRERQEEDNEHDEVREDAEPAVADTTISSVCSTFSSTSDFVCIGPAGVR
uniref:Candidate secreted effector n=1 Tax=Meloidogyne incognita TaxID=6306 RepID=A0A914KI38_MELIC